MTAKTIIPIYLDNDFEPQYDGVRRNTASGASEAAAAVSSLTFRISATDGGAALGTLTTAAVERTGTPGSYWATFLGSDLRTYLAAYVGAPVFLVFGDGVHDTNSDPCLVFATRRSG